MVPDVKLQFVGKDEKMHESLHEYKCTLQKQLQLVMDGALSAQKKYNRKRIRYENKNKHKDNFEIGDSVLLFVGDRIVGNKSKLLPKFVGPYTIIQRMGLVTLKIKSEHGFEKAVQVSKLRKLYIENENKESETLHEQKLPQLNQ
ncbi:hypothetical protein RFI_21787 [Reticulomyxa filosa]|uniref:Uncharacterized protein n=1 Tax=Reticulomyxa filosa TaxID=46433 RepID=X6MR45_RETFI|nr:hypothetical protein RFI_21787 [Reticulomyxa filosa]|eukprot:ETO15575.1 hypothetical protein RFI_21787 [Reticulomyxa filosa]